MPSTLPSALNAAYALITSVMPKGVDVVYGQFGPWTGAYEGSDVVVFASRVPFDQEWGAIGRRRRNEVADIQCAIFCEAGDDDIPTRVGRVFELLGLIENALSGSVDLGTAQSQTMRVQPKSMELVPGYQTDKGGTGAQLTFALHLDAHVYNTGG